MEVESKQAEVLEQFCLLAKSARGRALVELVSNATSDPNLFAFGELLDVPQIKQLADSEHAASLELLKLFAFGTWPQYKKCASELPPLNQAQSQKLKQLTVVTLAESSKVLPYDVLMAQLDIGNVRELEDLLINDCMYTGIVRGKLDQKRRCFEVQFAVGRDLRPGQLESMMDALADWLSCSEALLSTIEERIQWADEMGQQRARTTKEVEEKAEEVKRSVVMEINLRQESMFGDFSGPSAMQYRMDEGEERVCPKRSAIRRR